MSRGSSSIFLALLGLFLIGFLIMVVVRLIANAFVPDETLSSWGEIPWRVYVAVMEGSAAETDGGFEAKEVEEGETYGRCYYY